MLHIYIYIYIIIIIIITDTRDVYTSYIEDLVRRNAQVFQGAGILGKTYLLSLFEEAKDEITASLDGISPVLASHPPLDEKFMLEVNLESYILCI